MSLQIVFLRSLGNGPISAWLAGQIRELAAWPKTRRRQKRHEQSLADLIDAPDWLRDDLGLDDLNQKPSPPVRRLRIRRAVRLRSFW